MHGLVKWFNSEKMYGFIQPDEGDKDVFVHISALQKSGIQILPNGCRVDFDIEQGRKGMQATNVKIIG